MSYTGLTSEEVDERVRAGKINAPVEAPFKTSWQIVRDNTFTYFNAVFAVLAVILFAVGAYRSLTFLPVIIANTLIGIIQEFRVKHVLEKLTVMSVRDAVAIRDGKEQQVSVNDLVLDDVVIFKAGNQIPADAVILDGEVSVNEALLTGEADDIQKGKNAELLSGSFIISGECAAKVVRVGAEAYAAKLTLEAKAIKTGEQSEIIRSLNQIVRMAGIAIIPIGIFLFARQFFFRGDSLLDSVQGMSAAIIGMIPEGLFLLASVALAISAMRLAMNKVLVHEMKCIETLARVDVLCVDKTGTITSPEMSVQEIVALEGSNLSTSESEEKLAIFVHSMSADTATMEALKKHFKKPSVKAEKIFPFSPQTKSSSATIGGKKYTLGAPEFVLGKNYEKYKAEIEKYSRKGYRVLVFALGSEPLALVTLMNPVRESAPETFRYFAEQGVEIKVISGDNALTVSEVAKNAGIKNAGKYIDARNLKTEADFREAVEKYVVFGRVLPEQKRKLVKALQAQKHTVAMTGDGVNDVLALKDADCSIAMASGSDAAVHAAQLVLLDSDFSKMPQVVREGRRVVNNLERSGSLFIVKNVFSFIAAIFSIVIGFRYPLLPAQVSLVTMWTIGVPSFFLSQMPNEDLIRGRFITNILRKAVPGGLTDVVLILLTYLLCVLLGVSEDQISTACSFTFAIVGVVYLFRVCSPPNIFRMSIWTGCLLGLLICFGFFRWFFQIAENIEFQTVLIPALVGLLAIPLIVIFERLLTKVIKFE